MAIVLIPSLAMTAASCGGDGGAKAPAQVVEIVVPAGTQAKLDRGELVDVMPAELHFKVGDVLRIRNDDSAPQFVGPYRVEAGAQFELTYGAPGQYGGLCNLAGGAGYKFVITE
ncbi:MAG: hypothetical protein ABI862_02010 [Ilumatobacteraceae bacterium]